MDLAATNTFVDFSLSFSCSNDEIDWLKDNFSRKRHRGIVDYRGQFAGGVAWFYSLDAPGYEGAPYRLALFLKQFLKTFRKNGYIGFSYTSTTQEYVPGGFAGGAYFVTAYRVYHYSTAEWLSDRTTKFENMRKKK